LTARKDAGEFHVIKAEILNSELATEFSIEKDYGTESLKKNEKFYLARRYG